MEKVDREKSSLAEGHRAELDLKNDAIAKLKDELAQKDTLLELTKEELASKTEELQVNANHQNWNPCLLLSVKLQTLCVNFQDLMVDLEVKEAGFNNSFRETSETHKEEIEILVSKVEEAKKELSELHETLAK